MKKGAVLIVFWVVIVGASFAHANPLHGSHYLQRDPFLSIWIGYITDYGEVLGLYSDGYLEGYAILSTTTIEWMGITEYISTGNVYLINSWGQPFYVCDVKLAYVSAYYVYGVHIPESRESALIRKNFSKRHGVHFLRIKADSLLTHGRNLPP